MAQKKEIDLDANSCVIQKERFPIVPAKIGMNESSAGEIHVFSIIIATFRLVIFIGYLRGLTIA